MYQLRVTTYFAAAHQLREYEGKCENLHGHNWRVDVVVASDTLDDTGMAIDFKVLKGLIEEILDDYDHRYLNDVPPFDRINPTTENMARHLYERLGTRVPDTAHVESVTCWESERCGATYRET